jgi:hypothetical protein
VAAVQLRPGGHEKTEGNFMSGRRVQAVFVALLLGASVVFAIGPPLEASSVRFSSAKAPVAPDGTTAGAPTDFVISWASENPAISGIGLREGGSVSVRLDDAFVDTGEGANAAILLQGWQASPRVLSFPPPVFPWATEVDGNVITARMKPGQSFLPDETGPGPKQVHLLLNSFRNPSRADYYWADVTIDPDPTLSGDEITDRVWVQILPDARPSVNLVQILSGNPPPPPFKNVQFQESYTGQLPDPVGFYLWDWDSVPFVGVNIEMVSPSSYRLVQNGREVGHISVHAPSGASGYTLESTGPSVEVPAFATSSPTGAFVLQLHPDPDAVGEYHVRIRIHAGNQVPFFLDVKPSPPGPSSTS